MKRSNKFRVLSTSEGVISTTNQRVLEFGCSEIKYGSSSTATAIDAAVEDSGEYQFNRSATHTIVLDENIELATVYEKSGPSENLISIDWADYPNREELNNGKIIYYHKSVILKRFQLFKSPISFGLEKALGHLYYNYQDKRVDPFIFSQLRNEKDNVNVYLIAKNPNEDLFYGIIESPTIKRKLITLPLANIVSLDVWEIPVKPFNANYYVKEGIKDCNDISIRHIRPHQGIDGVTFGMHPDEIIKIFGKPDSQEEEFDFLNLNYKRFGLEFSFYMKDRSGLFSIMVKNSQYKLFGFDFIGKTEEYIKKNKLNLGIEDLELSEKFEMGISCYTSPSLDVSFYIDSGIIESILIQSNI
ncbi:hypothetical protein VS868_04405 [Salinimicrobium sp. 3283s]|uniref:hypothetical protein n=1 Tax=Salinimicrobium sp. 3283s TaxID=3114359 RepID=UPI0031E6B7BB